MTDTLAAFGGWPAVTLPAPRSWPWYGEQTRRAVADRVGSGAVYAFGRDPALTELEDWARDYFGVPHALATSSGTAALQLAYAALGVGPGDEVLVPTYTFHASATPLFTLGAVPVLVDCAADSVAMSVADTAARITSRTKAICVTHMFGLPVDVDAFRALADTHGLALVEDAAQAHGATVHGVRVGRFGDAACFSVGGAKMVSGGHGGLLLTRDVDVYESALVHGHAHERAFEELRPRSALRPAAETGFGANFRMHPLAAVLALDHARSLDDRIGVRTGVLTGLSDRLGAFGFLRAPVTPPDRTRGGWYGYKASYDPGSLSGLPIDAFVRLVRAEGVRVGQPTTRPLHMTAPFRDPAAAPPGYGHSLCRRYHSDSDLPHAADRYAHTIGFPDKKLHVPADGYLDQYAEALHKVAAAVLRHGADKIVAELGDHGRADEAVVA